jgi:hypothetical protein
MSTRDHRSKGGKRAPSMGRTSVRGNEAHPLFEPPSSMPRRPIKAQSAAVIRATASILARGACRFASHVSQPMNEADQTLTGEFIDRYRFRFTIAGFVEVQ